MGVPVQKLIITAAITGAETTKEANPALPITPEEQAIAARECVEEGASIIHLHVRDKSGRPSQSVSLFREAIDAINEACNPRPIIQISTGGAVGESFEKRMEPVRALRPEMASLNINSMNFGDDVFINHPKDVKRLAGLFLELGVVPEIEVYDVGDIELAKRYAKEGLIKTPMHYQFVLGVPGGMSGWEENLKHLLKFVSEGDTWGVAGIGRYEMPLASLAIELGGFVRVGLEDNIYIEKGVLAKGNAELVRKVADMARQKGREIATPDEARNILGIPKRT
jgi:3-keto-5-aminohexanoate cleavage enzyme